VLFLPYPAESEKEWELLLNSTDMVYSKLCRRVDLINHELGRTSINATPFVQCASLLPLVWSVIKPYYVDEILYCFEAFSSLKILQPESFKYCDLNCRHLIIFLF
jgi:hypothetical protein